MTAGPGTAGGPDPGAPDDVEINSEAYWDGRFRRDWADLGGNAQTRAFMELLVDLLPDDVRQAIVAERLEVMDWGCAEGDGVPVLERALPGAHVVGVDISAVAVARAGAAHPTSAFRRLDLLAGDERTDVVVCSNVLEHFTDPREVLDELARRARQFVVVLVPFLESPRIDEHEATFSLESFPLSLPNGKRLIHARTVDLRWRRRSPWPGMQILVVYGPDATDATLADLNQFEPVLRRRRDRQQAVVRMMRPVRPAARALRRLVAGLRARGRSTGPGGDGRP